MPEIQTSTNGKAEPILRSGETAYLLFDFNIEGTNLKFAHMEILKKPILDLLDQGGSITIIGMADRTGGEALNKSISRTRADRVLGFLKDKAKNKNFRVAEKLAEGTKVAASQNQPANTSNERYRSVYVSVWKKPDPPPDPPPIRLPDGTQILNNVTPTPDLATGQLEPENVIDIVSGIGGVVGMLADFLGAIVVATLMDLLGIVAAVVQAFLWLRSDVCGEARFNNYVAGYWDAIQDMATQYKDSGLDTKPYDQWPAILPPKPHLSSTKDEDLWTCDLKGRNAQRDGCTAAYYAMVALEANPKDVKTDKGTVRVRGRLLLRALYKWKGNNVDEEIKKLVNKKLKERGMPEWPTRGKDWSPLP